MINHTLSREENAVCPNKKNKRKTNRKSGRPLGFQTLESRMLLNSDATWLLTAGDAEYQTISASATDAEGSTYVAIGYRGSFDLAPSQTFADNRDLLAASDSSDAIAKYDVDGNLIWANAFENLSTTDYDSSSAYIPRLHVEAGGVYLSGDIRGRVDVDPFSSASNSIIETTFSTRYGGSFVAQFDAATGDFGWQHTADGETSTIEAFDVAVDGSSYFSFGSGLNQGQYVLDGQTVPGSADYEATVYIASIDPNGTVTGTQRLRSDYDFTIYDLEIDDSAADPQQWNLVGVGNAEGKIHFGDAHVTGAESSVGEDQSGLLSQLEYDPLVFSLSSNGQLGWGEIYETPGNQTANHLFLNDAGDLYVEGGITRFVDDYGTLEPVVFEPNNPDAVSGLGDYILHLDADGNFIATASLDVTILALSPTGDVLVDARAKEPVEIGGALLTPTENGDRYLLELDPTLSTVTALINHDSRMQHVRLDDGFATIAGNFDPALGEAATLPNGTAQLDQGDDDIYITRFELGSPLSLPAAETVVLFEDSFESGSNSNDFGGKWVEDSQNDWFRNTQRASRGGQYSAEVDGYANNATLTMSNPVDLSSVVSAELSLDWLIEYGFDTGEYLAVDAWDGSEWVELQRLNGNDDEEHVWKTKYITLDESFLNDDFKVRFRSKVSSSREDANVDNVRITGIQPLGPPNATPIAHAGGPYLADEGVAISLDGSASLDADGSIVSFAWDFDGDGLFDDAAGASPTFTSIVDGVQTISLQVTDDRGATGNSHATVNVQNQAPTANAGGAYFGDEGADIALDASQSTDPADDIVTYEWDLNHDGTYETPGTSVVFNSTNDGTFTVGMRVTDDAGAISTDTATVTVNNVAPTADAGGPYTAETGDDLTVSASASSDSGNDIVSYEWDLDNDGQFDDSAEENATFTASVEGDFIVRVRVTDDVGESAIDSATLTISDAGPAPIDDSDLVARWTFDSVTTDTAPDGSVADNGTLVGNAAFATDLTRGTVIELDGSGDRFDVRDSTDLNKTIVSQRTISLWFNADEVNSRQVLFEEGGGSRGLSIYVDAGQIYVGGWNKPGGESGWSGTFLSTTVTAGAWHNIVLTLDGGSGVQSNVFKGYLDGQLFGSGAGSQLWGHSGDVGIGMMDDATVFHDGKSGGDGFGLAGRLDDVRIYDRVFASDEVQNLWMNY